MDMEFLPVAAHTIKKQAVAQIIACNEETSRFGLVLSPSEAQTLVESRADALRKTGRVEFEVGIFDKLILEFCDSPFISQSNYAETMSELVDIFYYYKDELDWLPDDELIHRMKKLFNENCQGSVDHLRNSEMEKMVYAARRGHFSDTAEDDLRGAQASYNGEDEYDE